MQRLSLPPGRPMCEHCVENHEELAHAGGKRHFLGFAGRTARVIADANDGIEAGGDNSIHVQDGSRVSSTTPHRALALQPSTVAMQWRDADQLDNLFMEKKSGAENEPGVCSSYGAMSGPISSRVTSRRHRYLPVSDRLPFAFHAILHAPTSQSSTPLPYSYEPTLSSLGWCISLQLWAKLQCTDPLAPSLYNRGVLQWT